MAIIKNPITIIQGASDEQLNAWAEVNTALEKAVGPYPIEPTTASYFTFEGSTVTGWIGPNEVTEIVIPRSYSMSQETISMNGAPIIKDQIIPTLTSFTNVVFCKSDGTNQHTYTSPAALSSSFLTDFPDDDVVLVSIQVSLFGGNLANKLNSILATPFIAATSSTAEKIYYTNVEDFTDTLTVLSSSAYFSGDAVNATYFDGNDYQVTTIGGSAFDNCSNLTSIEILSNVTSIGDRAFSSCDSLTSVTIPSSVTSIGDYAFRDCNALEKINITDIDAWAMADFGNGYANPLFYGDLYLNGELVTEVTLTTATKIGEYPFYNCSSLTSIEIPSSVTSIGGGAFTDCSNLTSITIPDNVTSIGESAFRYCTSLTEITVLAETPPTIQLYTFEDGPDTRVYYVPDASVDAYKTATNWVRYADQIQPLSAKGGNN